MHLWYACIQLFCSSTQCLSSLFPTFSKCIEEGPEYIIWNVSVFFLGVLRLFGSVAYLLLLQRINTWYQMKSEHNRDFASSSSPSVSPPSPFQVPSSSCNDKGLYHRRAYGAMNMNMNMYDDKDYLCYQDDEYSDDEVIHIAKRDFASSLPMPSLSPISVSSSSVSSAVSHHVNHLISILTTAMCICSLICTANLFGLSLLTMKYYADAHDACAVLFFLSFWLEMLMVRFTFEYIDVNHHNYVSSDGDKYNSTKPNSDDNGSSRSQIPVLINSNGSEGPSDNNTDSNGNSSSNNNSSSNSNRSRNRNRKSGTNSSSNSIRSTTNYSDKGQRNPEKPDNDSVLSSATAQAWLQRSKLLFFCGISLAFVYLCVYLTEEANIFNIPQEDMPVYLHAVKALLEISTIFVGLVFQGSLYRLFMICRSIRGLGLSFRSLNRELCLFSLPLPLPLAGSSLSPFQTFGTDGAVADTAAVECSGGDGNLISHLSHHVGICKGMGVEIGGASAGKESDGLL